MKGVIIYDDEKNQPQKMTDENPIVNDQNSESSSQDEEQLPDAIGSEDYDESSTDDDDSTDMEDYSDMDELPSREKGEYRILSVPEIQKCQEDDVINVSNVLAIPKAAAIILLIYCDWNIEIATERWLSEHKEIREELGLPENLSAGLVSLSAKDMTCGKCSAPVPEYLCSDTFCGHKFCKTCWQDFIGKSLRESNLILRCPDALCEAVVNQDIISMVASESDQKVYCSLLLRSYLADGTRGKWCPTPGCNHALILIPSSLTIKFTCKCLLTYCFRCLKEAHQPCSCSIYESWRLESLKQSPNWNLACIRQCPKCYRTIELQGWHKHVECAPCNFHFCGTCSCSWFEHGRWDGDQYTHICPEEKLKEKSEIVRQRAQAIKELARYQDYFAQFKNLQMDQERALFRVQMMKRDELKVLAEKQGLTLEEVSFAADAWLQVAECKRVFKWACVYDYYFVELQEKRRPFFHTMIKHGAFVINSLGACASEVKVFIDSAAPSGQFSNFRERLCLKTRVAKNFFENLEIAIKNGCLDIENLRCDVCSRESIERKPGSAVTDVGTSSGPTESSSGATGKACVHCSFPSDYSTTICVMCYQ
ncbi:hypothetical protein vseg_014652 [Gypsophila vaccaria]